MDQKFTDEQLNKCSRAELAGIVLYMQEQMDRLNRDYENLIEQIRISNQHQFGRRSEKLEGQLCFFNECEHLSEEAPDEPDPDDILPAGTRKKKQKGRRDADLKGFPEELFDHCAGKDDLDSFFGAGSWREMPPEEYRRLRYEPASWTVERHTVHVYVGTGGDHQDEFVRGGRPKDLLRNSIATPSLAAAVINAKYVNSIPLNRIEQEFRRNGLALSRQTMANWVIQCADRYLAPVYARLHSSLMEHPVTQSDETPVEIIHDGRPAGSRSYMWVHRSGERSRLSCMNTRRPGTASIRKSFIRIIKAFWSLTAWSSTTRSGGSLTTLRMRAAGHMRAGIIRMPSRLPGRMTWRQ